MSRILIVDDMPSIRDFTRAILGELGLNKVDEAKDGQEALGMLNAMRYDLLISDWNMPRLDGLGLLKAVRASETMKAMPVIMLTGETSRENVEEAIGLGVAGFVAKPFKPQSLMAAIRRVIPAAA
ncbi:MAG: cheY [Hydrocarboniphaga sp.]|uniref:response regulator n=1 Tax=Hydrocarboniphaga sp. TaxID=2033016 RepID=UPI002629D054|nr:response regulator [Hydrocarboniphaga sp.]MDB5969232.1 cheY [Hydrocarboniphaga sp.]